MKQFITFGHHLGWNMNIPGLFESRPRVDQRPTYTSSKRTHGWGFSVPFWSSTILNWGLLEHHQNKFLLEVLSPFRSVMWEIRTFPKPWHCCKHSARIQDINLKVTTEVIHSSPFFGDKLQRWDCMSRNKKHLCHAQGGHSTWIPAVRHLKRIRSRNCEDIWSILTSSGFVWKCWVYPQWNSHLVGIMISKTIGFRGFAYFQTNPSDILKPEKPETCGLWPDLWPNPNGDCPRLKNARATLPPKKQRRVGRLTKSFPTLWKPNLGVQKKHSIFQSVLLIF